MKIERDKVDMRRYRQRAEEQKYEIIDIILVVKIHGIYTGSSNGIKKRTRRFI